MLLLFGSGCATVSLSKVAVANQNKLEGLMEGMNKEEALKTMGSGQVRSGLYDFYAVVKNPYKTEVLKGSHKTIEVVYYFTNWSSGGVWEKRPITDNELTPLIFEDGKLIAYDWNSLREITYKYELDKELVP